MYSVTPVFFYSKCSVQRSCFLQFFNNVINLIQISFHASQFSFHVKRLFHIHIHIHIHVHMHIIHMLFQKFCCRVSVFRNVSFHIAVLLTLLCKQVSFNRCASSALPVIFVGKHTSGISCLFLSAAMLFLRAQSCHLSQVASLENYLFFMLRSEASNC